MKFVSRYCFVFLTCFVFIISAHGDPSSYLPVSHRAYDFLERMECTFGLPGMYLGTKPATRAEIARLLFGLAQFKRFMTEVEMDEFTCLLNEFNADFSSGRRLVWDDSGPIEKLPGFLKSFVYRNRRNLYSSYGDNYSLYVDPVVVRKLRLGTSYGSSNDDSVYVESSNGFILRGTVGSHLGFHVDVRDSKEYGSRDYPETFVTTMPGRGYVSFKGDRAEFDETSAHVTYTSGPFVVSYGRGRNVWGRGKSGTLMMSGYGSPYDMLRLETGFWRLKFVYFAAEIEQYPPIAKFYYNTPSAASSDSVAVGKHISGHRIEINFTDYFTVGLQEAIIYGGRWDLSYLNPLMFYKGAEHTNGDHDNALMGLDFRLLVRRGCSLYGEVLIDDITTSKLGTDWYGNKLAFMGGSYITEPFRLENTDMRIEYTRINPWVYTHRIPINSYTHYGDVLGHPLGPNSDEIYVELRKRFSRRFHAGFSFIRQRHGANASDKNVGGNPLDPEQSKSGEAHFLAGTLEERKAFGIELSYEVLWELFVKLGYMYEDVNDDGINCFQFSFGLNE